MKNRGKNVTDREVEAYKWLAMLGNPPHIMSKYTGRPRNTIYRILSKHNIKHIGSVNYEVTDDMWPRPYKFERLFT